MTSLADVVVSHAPDGLLDVRENESKGRYTVAATKIPAGTIVWQENGFASLPRGTARSFLCDHCMKVNPTPLTTKCEVCNISRFCNETCQQAAMDGVHGIACKGYQILQSLHERFSISVDLLQMLALLLARAAQEENQKGSSSSSTEERTETFCATFNNVLELVSHKELFSPKFHKDVRNATNHLCTEMNIEEHADKEIGIHLIGIIKNNIHGDVDELAFGLYPGLAMFCHSCCPTCVYQISGGKAVVRTCVDVMEGGELSIAYLSDLLVSRARRADNLQKTRHFSCMCERCKREKDKDLLEAFICPKAECYGVVHSEMTEEPASPDHTVVCDKCGTVTPVSMYENLIDKKLGPLLPHVPTFKDKKGGGKICKRIASSIQKPGGIHELNELMLVTYKMMAHVCEADEDWAQAAQYVRIQLRAYEYALPKTYSLHKSECHRHLAYLYGKQADTLEGMDDPIKQRIKARLREQQDKHAAESTVHLNICLGKDASSIKAVTSPSDSTSVEVADAPESQKEAAK